MSRMYIYVSCIFLFSISQVSFAQILPSNNFTKISGRHIDDNGVFRYSWPGIVIEANFFGTAIGFQFEDTTNHYNIEIDGQSHSILATPGEKVHWIDKLSNNIHHIRISKRTESHHQPSAFLGFITDNNSRLLSPPLPRTNKIVFSGDSFTAGYGNQSDTRECSATELQEKSNTDVSYAVLTAKHFNADFHINAYSGSGLVRNHNGKFSDINYRSMANRVETFDVKSMWIKPKSWTPQLAVIWLGINDFSTSINAGEKWTKNSLSTAYIESYKEYISEILDHYGKQVHVLLLSAKVGQDKALLPTLVANVKQHFHQNNQTNVEYMEVGNGITLKGCSWHPSASDHVLLSKQVINKIDSMNVNWK